MLSILFIRKFVLKRMKSGRHHVYICAWWRVCQINWYPLEMEASKRWQWARSVSSLSWCTSCPIHQVRADDDDQDVLMIKHVSPFRVSSGEFHLWRPKLLVGREGRPPKSRQKEKDRLISETPPHNLQNMKYHFLALYLIHGSARDCVLCRGSVIGGVSSSLITNQQWTR